MKGVAWFGRRWKWVAIAIVAVVLPAVTFIPLNRQRGALIEELQATAGVNVTPMVPASIARMTGLTPSSFPWLLWRIEVPEPVAVNVGTSGIPEQARRAVDALNRVGGARSVQAWGGFPPPEAFRPLVDLQGLERLDLRSLMVVGDEGAAVIAGIGGLRELRLSSGCSVGTAGFEALASLPRLERLEVTGVAGPELEFIAKMNNLRDLNLDQGARLDADELKPLTALKCLERLSLVNGIRQLNTIDGAYERDVLPLVRAMPRLKELRIGIHGGVPAARVRELEAVRPGLKVTVVDVSDTDWVDRDW